MIRLLIADDHLIFRQGMRGLLACEQDLQVVAEAGNFADAIDCIRCHEIDVAIVDLSMPGRDGIELIRHIKLVRPGLHILVLTMHVEEQYALRALKAGASGYVTKNCAAEQLVTAVRRLAAGGKYLTSDIAERLALQYGRHEKAADPHTLLSNREFKIFEMLVKGKTVSGIARELAISDKTVSTHKARLLEKMNLHSQADLVRYALMHGLEALPVTSSFTTPQQEC